MYNLMFGKRKKFELNNADLTYKVHYLGNVMTSIMKGDGCVDKAVQILWDNHLKYNGEAGLKMKLTLTQGGLRVNTKSSGITDYYGHRIHYIISHPLHSKLFVWVYQHVGKNLKTEIRCHAVLCRSTSDAKLIEYFLNERLKRLFDEYKREKKRSQNSRLLNTFKILPVRKKRLCSTGNYKPPVQRGMCSAPKLDDVKEEDEDTFVYDEDEDDVDEKISCNNNSTNDDDDDDTLSSNTLEDDHNNKCDNVGGFKKINEDLSSVYSSYTVADSGIDESYEFINDYDKEILKKMNLNQSSSESKDDDSPSNTDEDVDDENKMAKCYEQQSYIISSERLSYDSALPDQNAFIEVSYEFSSDLTKPQLKEEDQEQLNIFFKQRQFTNLTASFRFRNPFRRLHSTASFSSHTTYKKAKEKEQQQLQQEEKQKSFNMFLKNFNDMSNISINQSLEFKNLDR